MNGSRRTFRELRQAILIALLSGQQTTNEISIGTGINWRTAETHLTFLVNKGFVAEVVKLEYVRIFNLTPIGEEHARFLAQKDGNSSLQQPHDLFRKPRRASTTGPIVQRRCGKVNQKTQLLLQLKQKERAEKARKEWVVQP
ncbi:hypothetical protein HYU40_04370 [Candidatus Woesearchaeota archaeon]|nr:hypothetical protein [Candidatus Woesearchaeota archaeon]